MSREFIDYLIDILRMARSINGFVQGMTYEEFEKDEKTVLAVIQGFEIIGEAAKHIPRDIQVIYPEIEWASMARMRDLLIHHYFVTQYSILWQTIQNQIPHLLEKIPEVIHDHAGK